MNTRPCPECGTPDGMPAFRGETFQIEHQGLHDQVHGLSGWRCTVCGTETFDGDGSERYAAASDALVRRAREETRSEIRRIRRKLGLSQDQAARLTGGGHNAFSRYERGQAQPLPAVINLFRLLDRHPELLKELSPQ